MLILFFCKSAGNENCQYISKTDWFQQLASVILIVYFKRAENNFHPFQVSIISLLFSYSWCKLYNNFSNCFQVSVSLDSARSLVVCVEQEVGVYELEDDVRWPCNVKVNHFRTEIRLMKENSKLWSIYGKKSSASTSVQDEFSLMKVTHMSAVTHDTKLIGLEYVDKLTHYIHPGHHVRLKNLLNPRTDPGDGLFFSHRSSIVNSCNLFFIHLNFRFRLCQVLYTSFILDCTSWGSIR